MADVNAREIRVFLIENFLFGGADREFSDDDSLLELGIIDSTGVLELVEFLESDFGITVADEDLIPENLDSVNRVVSYVRGKLNHR